MKKKIGKMKINNIITMKSILICILVAVVFEQQQQQQSVFFVNGFTTTHTTTNNIIRTVSTTAKKSIPFSTSPSSSSSALKASFEDVLYTVEKAASSLASTSLEDPSNFVSSIPIMYFAGLLTSFSPCVWGLLPLTMTYISTAAGEREDKRALLPTIAFALGLASVFVTLGIAVSTFGGVFGSSGSSTSGIALQAAAYGICFAMGLQILGFVQLPLPSFQLSPATAGAGAGSSTPISVSSTSSSDDNLILLDGSGQILSAQDEKEDSSSKSNNNVDSLIRTFLLGGSSALVASPCATPVLASILAFVASSANPALGALLLLIYTLGYSTPLLIISSTGGQALANMQGEGGSDGRSWVSNTIVPWITPFTGGILLWYATNGLLVTLIGDPSVVALAPILE